MEQKRDKVEVMGDDGNESSKEVQSISSGYLGQCLKGWRHATGSPESQHWQRH